MVFPLAPGARLGRYLVDRPLGRGGMGEVWLATDQSLGRQVAIKVMSEESLTRRTARERFLREVRTVARLNHPNLVTIFEAGEEEGRPYYAMELLPGGDVASLLGRSGGRLDGARAADIGAQAAAGLAEAARAGVTHRDIKPSNLGLGAAAVVKVTDFGLAKSHDVDRRLTITGAVIGTGDYLAPEQATGKELDERADVYALGCTLYRILAGHPPFKGGAHPTERTLPELVAAHMNAPIPDVRDERPEVDDELAKLVKRCMAKQPDDRPRAAALAELLRTAATRLAAGPTAPSPAPTPAPYPEAPSAVTLGSPMRDAAGSQPGTGAAGRGEPTRQGPPPGASWSDGIPAPDRQAAAPRRTRLLLASVLLVAVAAGVTGWRLTHPRRPSHAAPRIDLGPDRAAPRPPGRIAIVVAGATAEIDDRPVNGLEAAWALGRPPPPAAAAQAPALGLTLVEAAQVASTLGGRLPSEEEAKAAHAASPGAFPAGGPWEWVAPPRDGRHVMVTRAGRREIRSSRAGHPDVAFRVLRPAAPGP